MANTERTSGNGGTRDATESSAEPRRPQPTQRTEPDKWVITSDGFRLALYTRGDPAKPTVVCVHGFPDDHGVWDPVAALLQEQYHVVLFDMRGAGRSDRPKQVAEYTISQLANDIATVARTVADNGRVHLLAHNWGGAAAWDLALNPVDGIELLSLTTIGSASAEYYSAWVRDQLRFNWHHLRDLFSTWSINTYMTFFQVPVIAPALFRVGVADAAMLFAKWKFEKGSEPAGYGRRLASRNRDGLRIYSANIYSLLFGAKPPRNTSEPRKPVPSLVIVPENDKLFPPPAQAGAAEWAIDCRIRFVDGGHWLPSHQPDLVAQMATEFIEEIEERQN
ncbi:alpha/beta fold hydrolase [Hoyosella sp. YIM 151337]|uniref:alpha/beta fold hydrolase n=1 Tax=Hoyosella sp. YIM 151337 TaxID=2992742 RepID=UPI002235E8B8|nr:alpha/beta fold hydrolase [Hoyosella sp. YIM 151337]MCW4352035.1 alpha/beta fold hydrolase [Hoyosella sp. YIM 151337]